ncbi:MAG: S8 family serine peptidase [bacterium]|jgi:subtilisin family serine protease
MHPRRFAGFLSGGTLLLYGILSLSGTSVEPDSRKIDPRILLPGVTATAPTRVETFGAAPAAESAIPMFVRLSEDDPDLPGKFLGLGGSAKRIGPRIYVGQIPPDTVRYVSNWPNIAYLEGSKRARHMLDLSRPAISADIVQAGTPGFPSPFDAGIKGDNVYLGFVDTGLDGAHPDFHTGGTGVSRVVHTRTSSTIDVEGHGTHVAGIAAGNGFVSGGLYTGMAPGASLMVGKTSFSTTDIIAAVQDLITFAESRSRPVAINLSLGLVTGSNDGTSGFESAINTLATGGTGSRRIIAAAAGNEQDQGEHFRTIIANPFGTGTISLHLLPTLSSPSLPQVEIWAYGATRDPNPAKRTEYDEYTVTVAFPGDSVTVPSGRLMTSSGSRITVSNRVDTGVPNGATHITISLDPALAGQLGTIRFDRTRNGGTGVIDGYVDIGDGGMTSGDGFFLAPALTGNIIEPANGDNVIAVGSFQTKQFNGSATPSHPISAFSSFGPTRDGRLKPDVAAPGEFIYSTRSFDAPDSNYDGIVSGFGGSYGVLRGTSMSTPHVTGVTALVWQSNPSLTGAGMRERLRRTADPVGTSPNTTWGFGRFNALRAVRESVASITAPDTVLPGVPVSLSSADSSAAFSGNSLAYAWSLPGKPAGSAASLAATTSTASFTPDLPGDYTVRLEVSQATPAGTPHGVATASIRANALPVAAFVVPASDNAGNTVTFRGSASDADGQPSSFHWVLVSRPSGSAASFTTANVDNAAFTPDQVGTYEIGLRTNDGLDNSALVVHAYSTLGSTVAHSSSGGGGGCLSITRSPVEASSGTSLFSVAILLLPAGVLGLHRFYRRWNGSVPIRHSLC